MFVTLALIYNRKVFEITYMFAWPGGYVNIALMQSANQFDTGLMSVMMVEEIRNICGELGVLSYTDVAQAFGKVPVDVQKMRKMNSRSRIVFHYYPCTDI